MRFSGDPQTLSCGGDLDIQLEAVPPGPAVFLIHAWDGEPYLSRTNVLRRRLKRLLRVDEGTRSLRLRGVAQRVEFWPVASRLQGTLVLYDLAKQYFPSRYLKILKLQMPAFVKLVTGNPFPRTQVTTRIGGVAGEYFGPFRSRATAELFEHELLSLFQLRRCQEDLVPSAGHPGCIYGEMNMCLRPCQQVVGISEYASETTRISEFLSTGGRHLLQSAQAARDQLSAELDYEEAARQHKRVEKIEAVLKMRDELVANLQQLNGIAILPSNAAAQVILCFMVAGAWQPLREFSVALTDQTVSMDKRLKEVTAEVNAHPAPVDSVQEHVAILSRWFYSSWRDGEWLAFQSPDRLSYRRLVGAISRVAERAAAGARTDA